MSVRVAILSIFPEIFSGFLETSLVKKAQTKELFSAELIQIRDFAAAPHFSVDDTPYGGGAGMVMRAEPLLRATTHAKTLLPQAPVILLTASGKKFTQQVAEELAQSSELIFVCGRYEGVDQRFIDSAVTHEISIGDFVLMGGEVAAMVVLEAVLRLHPEVIGNSESLTQESFCGEQRLLEAPHYTKPAALPEAWGSGTVPAELLSGNHRTIDQWRKKMAHARTEKFRPDLLPDKKS